MPGILDITFQPYSTAHLRFVRIREGAARRDADQQQVGVEKEYDEMVEIPNEERLGVMSVRAVKVCPKPS